MVCSYSCKSFLVFLGLVVLMIGGHSHYESAWVKQEAYQLCDGMYINMFRNCPSLYLEKAFVAASLMTFILSLVVLAVSKWCKSDAEKYICADIGYHAVASMLMLAGSICYLVSAEQIDNLSIVDGPSANFNQPEARRMLLWREKLVAGSLGILLSLIYGFTAVVLHRSLIVVRPTECINSNIVHSIPSIQIQDPSEKTAVPYERF